MRNDCVAVTAVTPSYITQIRNTSEAVKVRSVLELKGLEVKGILSQTNMHFCAHGNSAYGCLLLSNEFLHGLPVNVVDCVEQ